MKAEKIILVDDDTDLGNLLSSSLNSDGCTVHYQTTLANIEGVIEAFNPSILILDVEIGDEDGITRAKSILKRFPLLPILFISSHTETPEVARGVTAGGVGYIRKPFEMAELTAYIKRFSKKAMNDKSLIRMGSYTLNKKTRELHQQGKPMKQLSRTEFELLHLLIENKNEVVTLQTLAEKIWSKKYAEIEYSLNNMISRLRKILNNDPEVTILTIKNVGYKISY